MQCLGSHQLQLRVGDVELERDGTLTLAKNKHEIASLERPIPESNEAPTRHALLPLPLQIVDAHQRYRSSFLFRGYGDLGFVETSMYVLYVNFKQQHIRDR
jgi:hypothetical protein